MNLIVLSSEGYGPRVLLFGATITDSSITCAALCVCTPVQAGEVLVQLERIERPPFPPDWQPMSAGLRITAPHDLEPIGADVDGFALGIYWNQTNFRRI